MIKEFFWIHQKLSKEKILDCSPSLLQETDILIENKNTFLTLVSGENSVELDAFLTSVMKGATKPRCAHDLRAFSKFW